MNVKCRICQFFDWLPAILFLGTNAFAFWYVFSGVYPQIYDNAQSMFEVLPYALLAWLCIGWLCVSAYAVVRVTSDDLRHTLNKWRQECQDENEETP